MSTATLEHETYRERLRRQWCDVAPRCRRWVPHLEARPALGQVSERLLGEADLRPGERVLDVATGYGEPGLTMAQLVAPGGEVLLQDLSEGMLDVARDRAEWTDLREVEVSFLSCDVEELDLEDLALDAIVSRSALMYLTDPTGTLMRLRSFLRPGGRFVASVWGPPTEAAFAAPVPLICDLLDLPAPDLDAPGPFALADEERLAGVVRDAGFDVGRTGSVTATFVFASAEETTRFLRDCAPSVTALVDGTPEPEREEVWARVTEEAWRPFITDEGRVRLPNQALWISATSPT